MLSVIGHVRTRLIAFDRHGQSALLACSLDFNDFLPPI